MTALPADSRVDVAVLAGLFRNVTNSYKFLFFHSILDAVERGYGDSEELQVSLGELGIDMLANAWYPRVYFGLSFGVQDKVGRSLDRLAERSPFHTTFDRRGQQKLRAHLQVCCDDEELDRLLRYVPQRLLSGFFQRTLSGLNDHLRDDRVRELSLTQFHTRRPLYAIVEGSARGPLSRAILVHPDWLTYLRRNHTILRGWAAWEWGRYMTRRNPHVPAVPEKLFPPQKRASLATQNSYWRTVLRKQPMRCIYSGRLLDPHDYALDHFLPWKFVLHDQLWNLVPVDPSVNSSKSDALPAESYLSPLAAAQSHGITVAHRHLKPGNWKHITECYLADLKVPTEVLWPEPKTEALERELLLAYQATLPSLLALARQVGFADGWRFSGA